MKRESKRFIWSTEAKHRWHLSYNKVRRLDKIFNIIEKERQSVLKNCPYLFKRIGIEVVKLNI